MKCHAMLGGFTWLGMAGGCQPSKFYSSSTHSWLFPRTNGSKRLRLVPEDDNTEPRAVNCNVAVKIIINSVKYNVYV